MSSPSRIRTALALASLPLLLLPAGPAHAATTAYAGTIADAPSALADVLASTGATSVTGVVTDANGVIWQGVAGVRDASGAAPDPRTRYGIGSTSKMFTAAAVMQLVDAGKVGLDEPVVRYLPQFTMKSPQYRQITVRMLLDHSAGFPGSSYRGGLGTTPYARYSADVLKTLASSTLKTTPGAMSVYCNDCFTVAGEVVAAVSGLPFPVYVQRHLLAPLGMTSSAYVRGALPAAGEIARVVREGKDTPLEVANFYATGGLTSTAADMAAFARMLLNGGTVGGARLLTPQSITAMGTSQLPGSLAPVGPNPFDYGLGWDTVSELSLGAAGVRGWAKGGDTLDYHSSLVVAPDAGLAAFVAGVGTFSSAAAQRVADRLILNALVDRGELTALPAPVGDEQPPRANPTEDDFNAITGIYLNAMSGARRVARAADGTIRAAALVSEEWQESPSGFSFRTDGAWWPDGDSPSVLRAVTGWNRTYLVISMPTGFDDVRGDFIVGERVRQTAPTAAAWRARLGGWVPVSEPVASVSWLSNPTLQVSAVPGLTGYLYAGEVAFDASRAERGTMFLQVPLMWGRDLSDVVPVGDDLLVMGDAVWRKRASIDRLIPGRNAVAIGQGAAWRAVPHTARLSIAGARAWKLFDSDGTPIASGSGPAAALRATKGSLLAVFGSEGGRVLVSMVRASHL